MLESEDESTSESVSIILPEKRVGNIHKVSCNYIHDIAFGPNHLGLVCSIIVGLFSRAMTSKIAASKPRVIHSLESVPEILSS